MACGSDADLEVIRRIGVAWATRSDRLSSIVTADFDGDGLREALVGLFSIPTPHASVFVEMRRLEDSGNGNWVDLGPCAAPGQRMAGRTFAADTDGDGKLDLVDSDTVWSNNGSHMFAAQVSTFGNYQPLQPVDINGAGELDFLAGLNGTSQGLAILRQTGSQTFAIDTIYTSGAGGASHTPVLADVDDDGDVDVVVDSLLGGAVMQFWINQGGTFSIGPTVPITGAGNGFGSAYLAADVDADGLMDLAYVLDELVYVMRRNGPSLTYDPPVVYWVPQANEFVDVDQDGDPDLVGRSVAFNRRFDGLAAGQHRQFGAAGAGTGNRAPVLGCSGTIRTGETPVLRLRQAVGSTLTILTMGYQQSALPSPVISGLIHYGYPFEVTLWLTTTGTSGQAGSGTHDLPVVIPPGLTGVKTYFQHHVFDGGASNLVVHSNGLEFVIGA